MGLMPTVVITGAGYRQAPDSPSEAEFDFLCSGTKANIGAWIAHELVAADFPVLLLARSGNRLEQIKRSLCRHFPGASVSCEALDLLDSRAVSQWASRLVSAAPIGLVHSVGLSSGQYKVPHDNPYLPIDETPADLPIAETEAVVKSLLLITQALLPIFRLHGGGRMVVVSSMSGIRSFPLGFSHASAKAALHHATRSMALELQKDNIFVSEVAPGIVDTGLYDNEFVEAAVNKIAESFGYDYRASGLPMMPPKAVAQAVRLCLTADSHILSINMVAQGQWPHLGA
jgi:3-oxoacyl-[acyl-carrier protein] reductase